VSGELWRILEKDDERKQRKNKIRRTAGGGGGGRASKYCIEWCLNFMNYMLQRTQ
jgi:hypothetical protein